ncbi:ammonium transporter [Nocardia sp. NBC_00565]|uniref:ammonium transporter n=1 Tax=Nocardia sp. NBC_00565 TaxID=2975993 RepID=UPI002E818307|nr:ammonium transporter [Nocardia sp. NBC_00565]WUC06746.1 ammonium transporter [Nocardia sp. NBC_00565]
MIETSRIAAIGIACVAAIAPVTARAEAPAEHDIEYKITSVERVVTTTLSGGTFVLDHDHSSFTIRDESGAPVMVVPTRFTVGDKVLTVDSALGKDAKELWLTPGELRPAAPAASPVASPVENQAAMAEFSTRLGLAATIGTFVGTAIGLVIGGVTGCIVGLPLFGVGCIPAAIAGAGIGGILGTIAAGGPVLVLSAVELIDALNAPDGTTKWAQNSSLKPAN